LLNHRNSAYEPPRRVVVIGCRGVIGRALCNLFDVNGIPFLPLSSDDVDLLNDDATERLSELLEPSDSLVMLSALTPDKGRDRNTFMRNIRMANAVCGAIERKPVSHIVYMSSDAVYPMGTELLTEESCAAPEDLYGTMHRVREILFADAAKDVPLAILRCTLVCAATDTHNSYGPNRFRRVAREEGKITLGGAGEETRDHISVDDVAKIIQQAVGFRSSGVLNIATGRSLSFDAVARSVAECFDPPADVIHSPRSAPITHRHFDISALRRAFPDLRLTRIEDAIRSIHDASGN